MADQKISDLVDGEQTNATDFFLVARGASNVKLLPEDTTVGAITGNCKNVSGGTLVKGTPVYQVGTVGQTVEVDAADAGDPAKMPAIGVLDEELEDEEEGLILYLGRIKNVDTSAFSEGDEIFVGVGGGYTNVAPATLSPPGINQYIGRVLKVANETSPPNGSGIVLGTGVLDVVPNGTTAGLVQFRGTDGLFDSDSTFTFDDTTKTLGAKFLSIDAGTATTGGVITAVFKQKWDANSFSAAMTNVDIETDLISSTDSNNSYSLRVRTFQAGVLQYDAWAVNASGGVKQQGSITLIGDRRGLFSSGGSDRLQIGSQLYLIGNNTRVVIADSSVDGFGFSDSIIPAASSRHSAGWHRDGSGILGQRAGTIAQEYRIYRTFTATDNYARVNFTLSTTEFKIMPEGAGASDNANVDIHLAPRGTGLVKIGTAYEAEGSPTFITGYIRVKDSTGAILKLAVINEGTSP